jgi:hypothetical protein
LILQGTCGAANCGFAASGWVGSVEKRVEIIA